MTWLYIYLVIKLTWMIGFIKILFYRKVDTNEGENKAKE